MGSPRSSRRGTGGCSRRRVLGWGRRGRAKKSGGPVRRRWVPPTQDPAPVKVRLDDPRRGRHVRVAHDRPDEPVDVRRFERRHLAQRVAVELPELEHVGTRDRKGRGRWSLEPAYTVTDQGTVRDGRSWRLTSGDVGAQGACPDSGWPLERSELASFLAWYVELVSTRAVTGRVGLGAGGPPRRTGVSPSNGVPSGRRPPSDVASPERTSAA